MSKAEWKAVMTRTDFDRVRSDPRLPPLLALSRCLNSLRYSQTALMRPLEYQTPRARRERFAAFFYAGALLFEGVTIAEQLGKHFRALPAYRDHMKPVLANPSFTKLRSTMLKKLRDKTVFHFDEDVAATVLAHLDLKEYVFSSGKGRAAGDIYHELGDEVVVHYLIGKTDTEAEFLGKLDDFMTEVTRLFTDFTSAAERLIPEVLSEMGWHLKPSPRPRRGTRD